ncbi:MAG: hypothetical protein EPO28_16635, partial [Saprospiraceae bacterium]
MCSMFLCVFTKKRVFGGAPAILTINNLPMKAPLLSILLFGFFTIQHSLPAQVIYVNAAVSGGANDGTSWQNAYLSLHDALSTAQPGDSIWVATGTYYPAADGDRNKRFELPDGVKLFGGFSGSETNFAERDWEAHPTLLSGDIGAPDDSTDNSFNILYMEQVDSTTAVDGFFFEWGNANKTGVATGAPGSSGAAIYINGEDEYAYPKIWNCRFEHNTALYFGGAVFVNGDGDGSVAPQFFNCVFKYNKAGIYGGAILRFGGSWAEVENDFWQCTFEQNQAGDSGGAVYYFETERLDKIEFTGCDFIQNKAVKRGGGICFIGGKQTGTRASVIGCFFQKNEAQTTFPGGDFYYFPVALFRSDVLSFINCKFLETTKGNAIYADILPLDDSTSLFIIDSCWFEKTHPVSINSFDKGVTKISNTVFYDNSAEYRVLSVDSKCYIENSLFKDNTLKVLYSAPNKPFIRFMQSFSHAQISIRNSIFDSNTLGEEGILYNELPAPGDNFIINSTSLNNRELETGWKSNKAKVYVFNSIFIADTTDADLLPLSG